MKFGTIQISKATEQNWIRLGSDHNSKLTKRANKTRSSKRIVATDYLNNDHALSLLNEILSVDAPIDDIMYTLSVSFLQWAKIHERSHVKFFLSRYSHLHLLDLQVPEQMWSTTQDVLGFIYQSLITEGERISTGQYYTNQEVVKYMLQGKSLADSETFLDPCCGSGSFLMGVKTSKPTNLYGFDINPIAVLIASTNLLVRYSDHVFTPNIYCLDFLKKDLFSCETYREDLPPLFDNVYTNPPWGADRSNQYAPSYPAIKSKERASMVIVESLHRLSKNGELCFLLPTSLLKIKTHCDIRKHILTNTTIKRIDLFSNSFNGVYTDFFSIKITPQKTDMQSYHVTNGHDTVKIEMSKGDIAKGDILTSSLSSIDTSIINKMESLRHDDLTHSQWALGIVTGDNKNKVIKSQIDGFEPIYTGKEITPFILSEATSYIKFAPETFQQCAREELYRAPEKLIYKFIAKYPIVAYDDQQRLCLNSANVLIPVLDGISIRSAVALLNSSLYRYYYSLKFSDIKVLKGNLQKLPFPKLTQELDIKLSDLVDSILSKEFNIHKQNEIDQVVYKIFEINLLEQNHITKILNEHG